MHSVAYGNPAIHAGVAWSDGFHAGRVFKSRAEGFQNWSSGRSDGHARAAVGDDRDLSQPVVSVVRQPPELSRSVRDWISPRNPHGLGRNGRLARRGWQIDGI